MSVRSKPFGAGWGNISMLLVAQDHQFIDEAARDAYFLVHPGEMFDGLLCYIISTKILQRWSVGMAYWEDITPVIQGMSGYSGYIGISGFSGYSGYSGVSFSSYLHDQTVASSVWNVNHNLGNKYPSVQVIDSLDKIVTPLEIEFVDNNNLTITLSSSITGKASIR